MPFRNAIDHYIESRKIPEHIIMLISDNNAVMMNLKTGKIFEIETHELKKRIQEEINATENQVSI